MEPCSPTPNRSVPKCILTLDVEHDSPVKVNAPLIRTRDRPLAISDAISWRRCSGVIRSGKKWLFDAWVAVFSVKLTCSEIVRMEGHQGHEGVSKLVELVRAISISGHIHGDKCRARMACNNGPPGAAHISLICALMPSVAMPAFAAACITAACASSTSPPVSS